MAVSLVEQTIIVVQRVCKTGNPCATTAHARLLAILDDAFAQNTWAARLVDWAWGGGTWEAMIVRLKPVLLMIVAASIGGVAGSISTYLNSQAWTAYVNSAFAFAFALGLSVAYCLSRRFPPTLY
jgi:hypothetical protein